MSTAGLLRTSRDHETISPIESDPRTPAMRGADRRACRPFGVADAMMAMAAVACGLRTCPRDWPAHGRDERRQGYVPQGPPEPGPGPDLGVSRPGVSDARLVAAAAPPAPAPPGADGPSAGRGRGGDGRGDPRPGGRGGGLCGALGESLPVGDAARDGVAEGRAGRRDDLARAVRHGQETIRARLDRRLRPRPRRPLDRDRLSQGADRSVVSPRPEDRRGAGPAGGGDAGVFRRRAGPSEIAIGADRPGAVAARGSVVRAASARELMIDLRSSNRGETG